MAGYAPDVLVTAIQNFQKRMNLVDGKELIQLYHPLLNKMVEGKAKTLVTGPYIEWVVTDAAPGQTTQVFSSNEEIQGGRVQGGERLREFLTTLIRAYDVPQKDIREASGEQDIGELLKNYSVRDRIAWMEAIVQQIVMGNVAELSGIFTFNGDAQYNPGGMGLRGGWFQFVAPADQTGSVHDLARNGVNGWHNQNRIVTSYALNGEKRMRQAIHDTQVPGAMGKGAESVFADRGTFDNHLDTMTGYIFQDSKSIGTLPTPANIRTGVSIFPGVTMYMEPAIRIADFTNADAQEGVAYGICSETTHLFSRAGSEKDGGGWFRENKSFRLPFQPLQRYETELDIGGACSSLQRNFTLVGGARE